MKKRALFLCGGGALGSWQCGVLYGLVKKGILFDKIAGFSIGAINSTFYCFNIIEKAYRLWSRMSNDKVLSFSLLYSRPVKIADTENYGFLKKFLSEIESFMCGLSIFSGKKIKSTISRYITKNLSFQKNLTFYCISHCVETSLPFVKSFNCDNYDREIFINNLVASSSIPFIFPQVEERDENGNLIHLVDGGVIGKGKIKLDFFEGVDEVYVISNVADDDLYFKVRFFSISDLFEKKVRRILLYHNAAIKNAVLNLRSKPALFFIKPEKSLYGRVLNFDGDICRRLFDDGFYYSSFLDFNIR